jgi:hypothetical protein
VELRAPAGEQTVRSLASAATLLLNAVKYPESRPIINTLRDLL